MSINRGTQLGIDLEGVLEGRRPLGTPSEAAIAYAIANAAEIKRVLGLTVPADIREKPWKWVKALLAQMGLETEMVQSYENGERVYRQYITEESRQEAVRFLEGIQRGAPVLLRRGPSGEWQEGDAPF
jgi:hypothetical protein